MQGNRHIRANHAACLCLDSKPTVMRGYEFYAGRHEVGGFANASSKANAKTKFVDVGLDTVLVAKVAMIKGAARLGSLMCSFLMDSK